LHSPSESGYVLKAEIRKSRDVKVYNVPRKLDRSLR
jgi:hypothetical protein